MLVIVILVLVVLGFITYGSIQLHITKEEKYIWSAFFIPFLITLYGSVILICTPASISEKDYYEALGAKTILESIEEIDVTNAIMINRQVEVIKLYKEKREIIATKSKSIWVGVLYDPSVLDKYPDIDIPDISYTKEKDQN